MSFDMFINFFRTGEPQKISRATIARAFGAFADMEGDRGWWNLVDSSGVLILGDEDEIDCLCVNRPPYAEHPFWPALVHFLRETGGVLYWPGGGQVVTDQEVVAHLPPEMIESFGPPIVTASVQRILETVSES